MMNDSPLEIKIGHALYNADSAIHVRGFEPQDNQRDFADLLIAADKTLNRSPGWFFDTIGESFVIGFEQERSEGTKQNMGYIEVFICSVKEAEQIPLPRLLNIVQELRVDSFDQEPDPTRTISLYPRRTTNTVSTGGTAFNDHGDSTLQNPEPVHPVFIAELWEQYRRDSVQCRASIQEIERFVAAVDGSLSNLSFINIDQKRSDYFDVIGDQILEPQFKPKRLTRIVAHLAERDELRLEALPTYEDELRSRHRLERARVRNDPQLTETIDETIAELKTEIDRTLDQYPEQAARLMAAAGSDQTLTKDDESSGLTSQITSFVSGGGTEETSSLLDPDEFEELDREDVVAIENELKTTRDQIWEEIGEEILTRFETELRDCFEEETQRIARKAVHRLDETTKSVEHREADSTPDDFIDERHD